MFTLPHPTSLTQTIFQAQSLFFLRLCLGLSETETLKDFVLVFHPSPDPSPVSLYLLLLPTPTLTGLLCKSAPPGATESWFHVVTALVQQILHSLGHQTCPGQTDSWGNIASTIQVIPSRHVQTAGFGGQIWGRFMKRQRAHSQLSNYPSAQFQVLFAQHAGYRTFKEKGHHYFLTWTKAYFFFLALFLKTATSFWIK